MADRTREIDDVSGVETTGHEWDGIKELNNPMPRWWLWTFYATVIWGLAYSVAYPAWPGISGATAGILGWSSRGDLTADMGKAAEGKALYLDRVAATDVTGIMADQDLRTFAVAGGASAFKVYCVQCHGSGAAGGPGYPNLNDDDWIWGGDIAAIHQTIAHGIRHPGDPDARVSEMPAYGEILQPDQINQVAAYVVSLTGEVADKVAAEAGKTIFAENCAACHGEDAKGVVEQGAPNLADAIWLYGEGQEAVAAQVRRPRQGVMPAWTARLGDTTVKQLAVYVHSLGGGK